MLWWNCTITARETRKKACPPQNNAFACVAHVGTGAPVQAERSSAARCVPCHQTAYVQENATSDHDRLYSRPLLRAKSNAPIVGSTKVALGNTLGNMPGNRS